MKRKFIVIFVLLIACAMVFANGTGESAEGGKKTITIWCAYSQAGRIEAMDNAIAKFEQLNPDIDVVRELVPWANIIQKWTTSSMANALPQLVVAGDDTMIRLWEAGALDAANGAIDLIGKDNFVEGPLESFQVGDTYIAVPHYTMSWKMCLRKDWLDELGMAPPTNWKELMDVAVAMTDAPNRYGFDIPMSKTGLKAREWLNYFMRTNNAYYFDKNGQCVFNSPETIETVQFLVDLYKASGRAAAVNYSENDCIDNYAKSTVGIIFAAGSLVTNVSKTDSSVLENTIIIDTPSNGYPAIAGAGPVGIGKFKGVEYSDEANEFLKFLLTDEEVYREFLLSMTGMIPVTKAATNDSVYLSNPQVADYSELNEAWMKGAATGKRVGMEYGLSPYFATGIPGSEIEDMFQSIIVDGVSVEDAVAATDQRIKENLIAAGYDQK